jgi:hypothetical protein
MPTLESTSSISPCFVHSHNPHEIEYDLIVATTVPSVRAVITLLPNLEHPRWPNRGRYMPHVVVGDPGQREERISGNTITEHYLGVLVADAPDEIPPQVIPQPSEFVACAVHVLAEIHLDGFVRSVTRPRPPPFRPLRDVSR